MDFRPTGYTEFFKTSGAAETGSGDIAMACVYPGMGNQNPVEEGDIVVNHSEMVVRHLNSSFWNGE